MLQRLVEEECRTQNRDALYAPRFPLGEEKALRFTIGQLYRIHSDS
ncbi:MAG: hypothetical protein V7K53_00180 [Nostoc sp.]